MVASDTPTSEARRRTTGIQDSSSRGLRRHSQAASGRLAAVSASPAAMQIATARTTGAIVLPADASLLHAPNRHPRPKPLPAGVRLSSAAVSRSVRALRCARAPAEDEAPGTFVWWMVRFPWSGGHQRAGGVFSFS